MLNCIYTCSDAKRARRIYIYIRIDICIIRIYMFSGKPVIGQCTCIYKESHNVRPQASESYMRMMYNFFHLSISIYVSSNVILDMYVFVYLSSVYM